MKKYLFIFIAICISSIIAWAQSGWAGLFWFVLVLPFLVLVTLPTIIVAVVSAKRFTAEQTNHLQRLLTVLLAALFLHHLIVPVLTDSELANGVVLFPSKFMNAPPHILEFLSTIFLLAGIPTILILTLVLIVKLIGYRKANLPTVNGPPAQK